jgi:hypothetical protein
MKHEREFDTSYFHNPHVQGWTTPSSSWCWRRCCRCSRRATGSSFKSFSPTILAVFMSIWCILWFSVALLQNCQRGVYIVGFMSRRFCRVQDCIEARHEVGDGSHHVASRWVSIFPYLFSLVAFLMSFLIDLFFSRSYISQKNDVAKSLCPFDVRKVPKTQKHAKKTRKSASQC